MPASTSRAWQDFCVWLALRLSFDDTAQVLRHLQGLSAPSGDGVWRFVQAQSQAEEQRLAAEIAASSAGDFPVCTAVSDVYTGLEEEFVVYTDGICVKSQKPTRERQGTPPVAKQAKRHELDVWVLPSPGGSQHWIGEGAGGLWSAREAVISYLRRCYSGACLSVIAITDGARHIREELEAIFGTGVRVVLDWYHLAKRVYGLLSMVAHSRKEREGLQRVVLGLLWVGKVEEALEVLGGVLARNGEALSDLMGYLQKHREEIIDYGSRQACGKPIGSGVAEKAVDQVVGMRQKGRGMSWTRGGNRGLGILKVKELNAGAMPCQ